MSQYANDSSSLSENEENSVEMQDMTPLSRRMERQTAESIETHQDGSAAPELPAPEAQISSTSEGADHANSSDSTLESQAANSNSYSRVHLDSLPADLRFFIRNLQNHVSHQLNSHDHSDASMEVDSAPHSAPSLAQDLPPLVSDDEEMEDAEDLDDVAESEPLLSHEGENPIPEANATVNDTSATTSAPQNSTHVIRFVILYDPIQPANANNTGAEANPGEAAPADGTAPANPASPMRLILSFLLNFNGPLGSDSNGNFDDIMDRFFHGYVPQGPPPASKQVIEQLPKKKIEDASELEGQARCTICCEDYQVGEEMIGLPCKHDFHVDCLNPWMKDHNTCPICRYELPTEDASTSEYEKSRRQRMAERRIDEDGFFTISEGNS